jgi:mono/diheme cytochrome c family protein
MRHLGRQRLVAFLASGVLLAWTGLPGSTTGTGGSQSRGEPSELRAKAGKEIYLLHCASCHGKGGKGDGPMVEVLTVRPSDLTRLARDNGGVFPRQRVHEAIDGRREVRSHGEREMPVWGLSFQDRGRVDSQEEEIEARLDALLAFLARLQLPAR